MGQSMSVSQTLDTGLGLNTEDRRQMTGKKVGELNVSRVLALSLTHNLGSAPYH